MRFVLPHPRHVGGLLLSAVLVAAAATSVGAPGVGAGEDATPGSAPGASRRGDLPFPDPRVSPELTGVAVEGPAYEQARARFAQGEQRLAEARERFASRQAELDELVAREADLVGEINEAGRRRTKADTTLARLEQARRSIAVASYVRGGSAGVTTGAGAGVVGELVTVAPGERERQRVLLETAADVQLGEYHANRRLSDEMTRRIQEGFSALAATRQQIDETTGERDGARRDGDRAGRELVVRTGALADARLEARVVGTDLSLVALDAYWKAAVTTFFEDPGCHLRWQALAGIGRTESMHGTYGGGTVRADGSLSRTIIGIPLDGTNETEVVADSDGGELDGDPTVDRAVGPMQFIPGSWRTFGRDGNGDGVRDPQNMYDAARAAAGLLCRSAPLDNDAGLRRAFLRYNNSASYAATVLARTRTYDAVGVPGR